MLLDVSNTPTGPHVTSEDFWSVQLGGGLAWRMDLFSIHLLISRIFGGGCLGPGRTPVGRESLELAKAHENR